MSLNSKRLQDYRAFSTSAFLRAVPVSFSNW